MMRVFLGGSFDPVHVMHIRMLMAVAERLPQSIDVRLTLLPTAGNPFKGSPSLIAHRLAMLQLATADLPIDIQTCELAKTPPVYTIDTVQELTARYPNDRLVFVMGQDALASLPQWKGGLRILEFVDVWAFGRVGSAELADEILPYMTADLAQFLCQRGCIYDDSKAICDVDAHVADPLYQGSVTAQEFGSLSSSQIRRAIAQGDDSVAAFLPPGVFDYIKSNHLYINLC